MVPCCESVLGGGMQMSLRINLDLLGTIGWGDIDGVHKRTQACAREALSRLRSPPGFDPSIDFT